MSTWVRNVDVLFGACEKSDYGVLRSIKMKVSFDKQTVSNDCEEYVTEQEAQASFKGVASVSKNTE